MTRKPVEAIAAAGISKALQWGRVGDDAETVVLATGGGSTTYKAVFERQ